jgi:DNA gyrase subunit A
MSDHLMEDRPSIVPVSISEEMQRSFLDYSMSVIVSRALPDVRDGLKPVHRRILYTMHLLKNSPTGPYKKSARIVGDTMGRFHPHGDSAIYDALVRLSQPFSMRYPVVDGQGNFGSIDGDPPAAMRYTEVRMARLATEMLADIEKETVDFIPNYDDKEQEPSVLPTRFPYLLVNGASGIAVGMATNIPPHNLTEIVNALIALLKEPGLDVRDLLHHVQGPDFPTGGTILGRAGIVDAFRTGRGRITMRGRVEIEELKNDRQALVITEIPYQVNKAQLIERIAELVKDKVVDGISDIRDESDKDGIRVVVFVKREAVADIVLNNLYKHTQLQTNFSVNMIAIVDGRPRLLTLKDLLEKFLEHRRQVIIRRSEFELREAMDKREIVEGLGVASMDIDRVIELVRTSKDADEARLRLQAHDFTGLGPFLERAGFTAEEVALADAHYRLTERQAQAILDMRLQRLTGLQQEKLAGEYRQLTDLIRHLERLLGSEELLRDLMIGELEELKTKYGDERKTEILEDSADIDTEDLIEDVPLILTFTRSGYIKTMPVDMFRAQARGGKGKRGAQLRDDDDVVTHILTLTARSTVLFFTNTGRVFKEKAYCLPKSGPTSCGRPLVNFLRLQEGERVVAMMPVPAIESGYYIFFATRRGVVKKTELMYYSNINQNGIIAVSIDEGDDLIDARLTQGNHDVLLATHSGLVARFPETDVRPMGRAARGVRGIGLRGLDHVVSLAILASDETEKTVLSISERGFGKRSPAPDFSVHHRGSKGLLGIRTNERNGFLAAANVVSEGDHLIALTEKGNLIRVAIAQVRVISRLTMGFTIMKLPADDTIRDITILPAEHIRPEEADEVTEVAGDGLDNGPEEGIDEAAEAPGGTDGEVVSGSPVEDGQDGASPLDPENP